MKYWKEFVIADPRCPSPSIHPLSQVLLADLLKYSSYRNLLFFFFFLSRGCLVDSLSSLVKRVPALSSRQRNNAVSSLSVRTRLIGFSYSLLFFFFFYLRYQPIDRRDWSRYYSREISFLWWIKLTLCLSVTKFLTWFSMEICSLTRKKNLNRTMIISKIILLRNITNFHSQKFD